LRVGILVREKGKGKREKGKGGRQKEEGWGMGDEIQNSKFFASPSRHPSPLSASIISASIGTGQIS
jgi:hypothetical protein